MNTMSREARDLVATGKRQIAPSNIDRARVTELLREHLVPDLPVPAEPTLAWTLGKSLWLLVAAGTLGVVGVLASHFGGNHQSKLAPRTTLAQGTATQTVQLLVSPSPSQTADAAVAAGASNATAKAEPSSRTTKPPRSTLGEEVQILSRAEKELHSGRPTLALKAIDEHQRRFPSGILLQERIAARIQALCALGRKEEAKAETEKLKRSSPNSPQATRTNVICGANP